MTKPKKATAQKRVQKRPPHPGDATHDRLLVLMRKELECLKFLQQYQAANRLEYFNSGRPLVNDQLLRANPKQQLILDAWNNPQYKTFVYTGGNRSLGGETPIYDPIAGITKPVSEIDSNFHVMAFDGVHMVPAFAFKPFQTEPDQLYRITLPTGEWFVASGRHRVLSSGGLCAIDELPPRSAIYLPQSNLGTFQSTHVSNVPHWYEKAQDFQSGCPAYYGFYDGLPRWGEDIDQDVAPLLDGARTRMECVCGGMDGPGNTQAHTRLCRCASHLSIPGALAPPVALCVECECRASCIVWILSDLRIQVDRPPIDVFVAPTPPNGEYPEWANPVFETHCPPFDTSTLVSATIVPERMDVKWDIHVPIYNNYWAGGMIHQNSGKTTLGVIISLSVLFGQWLWNKQPISFPHKEPRKVRVISQDWESGVMKVLVPELKKWWPGIRPYTTRKNNMGAEAFWVDKESGSTLEIMTGNQDSMLHEGGHHDVIWADEPLSRAHYIANARGLVDRQGRELFTMTLLEQPWIDREVVRKKLPDGRPDPSVFVVETQTTDNVGYGLSQRGLDDFSAKLTEEEREVRIKGVPRYKKGLVYPMFKATTHCVPRFSIPLDWPVDIAIDTHPRKPHSVLMMATNPYGIKYCIAEIRMHGNGKQLADEIVRMTQYGVYRVNRVIIDPLSKGDGNDPTGTTYDDIYTVLARYGMYLETASKNKDTGILAVKDHLMGPNDIPSLFFFDDLVYTIMEMEGLMWHKDEEREVADKVGDDMCENLYRLVLLDTEYIPMMEETVEQDVGTDSVNDVTGY